MRKVSATVEKTELHKVNDLFTKKPPGLRFGDTDAAVLTFKTEEGERVRKTFYFRLKSDGTLAGSPIERFGRGRRMRFISFLKRSGIVKDLESFNVKKDIGKIEGVEMEISSKK